MQLTPIVLFVFKRPVHTAKVIDALKKNPLATESELFIFADGPKINFTDDDHIQLQKTRELISNITGFKKVTVIESATNKGLAASITSGVTQIINTYGSIIVLEDDIVTGTGFLTYMNEALQLYSNNEDVISIHGYNLPIATKGLKDTFFLKGADCWGWATWKRGWEYFNDDIEDMIRQLVKLNLQREFNLNNSYPYMDMLKAQLAGKVDSWAIKWYASAFLNNKFTLYPKHSLIENIGLDGTGTHGTLNNRANTSMHVNECKLYPIPVKESILALRYIRDYYTPKSSLITKLKSRLLFIFK